MCGVNTRMQRFVKVVVLFFLHLIFSISFSLACQSVFGCGTLVYWSCFESVAQHFTEPLYCCLLLYIILIVFGINNNKRTRNENITLDLSFIASLCRMILCVARIYKSTYYIQMRICNDQRTSFAVHNARSLVKIMTIIKITITVRWQCWITFGFFFLE